MRRFPWFVLVIVLLPGLIDPSPRHAVAPHGVTGVVEVRVQERGEGRGILGALVVVIQDDEDTAARGFSGEGGYTRLTVPAGGPYHLRAETMGYAPATSDTFRVATGDTLRLSPLELVPDGF